MNSFFKNTVRILSLILATALLAVGIVTDALPRHLYAFSAEVIPGLLDRHDGEQATFNGYGASCREVVK